MVFEKHDKMKTYGGCKAFTLSNSTVFFIIFSISFGIYSNSLSVPFQFDDIDNIAVPALQLNSFDLPDVKKALTEGLLKGRPISNLSFALNYFFGEYRVQGYHLVNIGIHCLGGYFLYLFGYLTLRLPANNSLYRNPQIIALFGALLWLAHPLGTQSVTYIVQRMNSMAAMFFILSILLYASGRKKQLSSTEDKKRNAIVCFLGSLVSGALAVGSKENAVMLPVFIFLYEWYFFQDGKLEWIKKKSVPLLVAVICFGTIIIFYAGGNPLKLFFNDCPGRDFTSVERLITQFRVVFIYLSLLIYPHPDRLNLDHHVSISTSLFEPASTLMGLVGILALLCLTVFTARKERLLSFAIIWFLGNLVIESTVICLELVFEHRTYLPSMICSIALVGVISRFVAKSKTILIIIFLLIISGVWTYERNKIWQSNVSLWEDAATKSPEKWRVHANVGYYYSEAGRLDEAISKYEIAINLNDKEANTFRGFARAWKKKGDTEKAEFYYREAIRLKRNFVVARIELGILLIEEGLFDDAADEFVQVLAIDGNQFQALKYYGNSLLRMNNVEDALAELKKAESINAEDKQLLLDLGEANTRSGNLIEAKKYYLKALEIDSESMVVHANLALLYKHENNMNKALWHFEQASKRKKLQLPLYYDYGNSLFREGKMEEAEQQYLKVLGASKYIADTYNNFGILLMEQSRKAEAVEAFENAMRINPQNEMYRANFLRINEELSRKVVD
ncbi:DUF6056 family protein [Desulfosediminicola sp.]|uniref:DUF6056 family protein n=1 Tax=Desulfosediminicola sp. TaxID=2886825 RepID=UPI003AF2FD84